MRVEALRVLEDEADVRSELDAVLASEQFVNSPQLSAFLGYIVEQSLAGKQSSIKAYSIATEALRRPESFDPATDATVRVLASRVRAALQLHYLKAKRRSRVTIELLPGSYVPKFSAQSFPSVPQNPTLSHRANASDPLWKDLDATSPAKALPDASGRRMIILDDDDDIRSLLRKVATDAGFNVLDVASPSEFWASYRTMKPSHVILDMKLADADGIEIMRELSRQAAQCKLILVSGVDSRLLRTSERLGRQFGLNVIASLAKPFDVEALERVMSSSLEAAAHPTAQELSEAIETSQIEVHFQPKIAISPNGTDRFEGVEALARWMHPSRGPIAPDTFIPVAEEGGLIGTLTWQILDLAITKLSHLSQTLGDFSLAINLSPVLLDVYSLPEQLAERLDMLGFTRNRLIIELTESVTSEKPTALMDTMSRLRLKGFRISIDDFGTGFSSLLRLLQLPFSELKIDRRFILEMTSNPEAEKMVEAVITLARNLCIQTCAEGVESAECLERLRVLGCDFVQGFHFSPAIPIERLAEFVRKFNERP